MQREFKVVKPLGTTYDGAFTFQIVKIIHSSYRHTEGKYTIQVTQNRPTGYFYQYYDTADDAEVVAKRMFNLDTVAYHIYFAYEYNPVMSNKRPLRNSRGV